MADDRTEKSEEIDEQATPLFTIRPVDKSDRSEDDVCREKVVAVVRGASMLIEMSRLEALWAGTTYESVRKPEAQTPQMRKFHEFKSSS